tara:strand:- start:10 stop:252 length:243 start_codon:yes stop_codon:yes gene_type:complete
MQLPPVDWWAEFRFSRENCVPKEEVPVQTIDTPTDTEDYDSTTSWHHRALVEGRRLHTALRVQRHVRPGIGESAMRPVPQ